MCKKRKASQYYNIKRLITKRTYLVQLKRANLSSSDLVLFRCIYVRCSQRPFKVFKEQARDSFCWLLGFSISESFVIFLHNF